MGERSGKSNGGAELTDRERFWLKHHKACEASGETAKTYAKARGLSVHALYQARKRLRAEGKLAKTVEPVRRRAQSRFAKVVGPRASAATRYRVRLGNGILVEWEGATETSELETVLRAASALG